MKRNPWKLAFLGLTSGVLATSVVLYGVPAINAQTTEVAQEQIVPSDSVLNPTTNSTKAQDVQPINDVPQNQTVPSDMKNEKDDGIPKLSEPRMKQHKLVPGTKKTAKLVVHVIDGRTGKPVQGAETVIVETGERFKSDATGTTPAIDAPVIREERYEDQVAALHGQLGIITYKNGYRDSITFGVRMHDGRVTDVTVWMYQISPGDRRIEPVFYHEPYHHLWLVQLADAFRSPTQPGEGQENPNR